MSRTTRNINHINQRLDEISGLDGIVADKVEELAKQVDLMVDDILENHSEASLFDYEGKMDKQQEIELYTNTKTSQEIILDMCGLIIALHNAKQIPLGECIDIYHDMVKEKVREINNNRELNEALNALKTLFKI